MYTNDPDTTSQLLEYQARRHRGRRAVPQGPLDGQPADLLALTVLVCSSLCLGALSWWLAVWG
jgi:hypothetical protein